MPTTIQTVNSSDTPNQGRVKWNQNDTNLKATADALEAQQAAHVGQGHPTLYYTKAEIDTQQSTQDSALAAHKTSGDHDTRYALLSALLDMVKLTTDQIIDGIKTFLKTIIIQSDTAAIELHKGDGTPKGRFSYDSNSDAISLDVRQEGSWQSLLRTSPNASHVNFPNHEVRSKGKILATEEYVQARIRSGRSYIAFQSQTIAGTGGFYVGGAITLPIGVRIIGAVITMFEQSQNPVVYSIPLNIKDEQTIFAHIQNETDVIFRLVRFGYVYGEPAEGTIISSAALRSGEFASASFSITLIVES